MGMNWGGLLGGIGGTGLAYTLTGSSAQAAAAGALGGGLGSAASGNGFGNGAALGGAMNVPLLASPGGQQGGQGQGVQPAQVTMPANGSGTLGMAPTGLYSGLDPSASMGSSYDGSGLGGGLSGQVAGQQPVSSGTQDPNNNGLAQALMMQKLKAAAQQIGQTAPINAQTGVRSPQQMGQSFNPQLIGASL